MHELLKVPEHDNPTSDFLSPHAAYMTMQSPLMAIGVLDTQKRPWTSIWGGEASFARPLGSNFVGVRNDVDAKYDPVVEALEEAEFGKGTENGLMVSALPIDLAARRRVKLSGRIVGGKVSKHKDVDFGEVQLAINVEQSLGKSIPSP
jgi:hypothetical protein